MYLKVIGCEIVEFIHLDQDTTQLRAIVNMVMILKLYTFAVDKITTEDSLCTLQEYIKHSSIYFDGIHPLVLVINRRQFAFTINDNNLLYSTIFNSATYFRPYDFFGKIISYTFECSGFVLG
jgi:hypothetical protein